MLIDLPWSMAEERVSNDKVWMTRVDFLFWVFCHLWYWSKYHVTNFNYRDAAIYGKWSNTLIFELSGRVAEWPSGRVAEWPSGRVAEWPSDPDGRVAEWPSGRVAEWPSDPDGRVAE